MDTKELPEGLNKYLKNVYYKRGKASLISCIVGIQLNYKLTYFKSNMLRKITKQQWKLVKQLGSKKFTEWNNLNKLYKKYQKAKNSVKMPLLEKM